MLPFTFVYQLQMILALSIVYFVLCLSKTENVEAEAKARSGKRVPE